MATRKSKVVRLPKSEGPYRTVISLPKSGRRLVIPGSTVSPGATIRKQTSPRRAEVSQMRGGGRTTRVDSVTKVPKKGTRTVATTKLTGAAKRMSAEGPKRSMPRTKKK